MIANAERLREGIQRAASGMRRFADLLAPGILCPSCGHAKHKTIYTRPRDGGRVIRRRECRRCGQRFVTTERVTG